MKIVEFPKEISLKEEEINYSIKTLKRIMVERFIFRAKYNDFLKKSQTLQI